MNRITFSVPRAFCTNYDIFIKGYDQSRFTQESTRYLAPSSEVRHEAEATLDGFEAKLGQTSVHFAEPRAAVSKQTMLVGLGDTSKLDTASLRKALTASFKAAQQKKAKHLFLSLNLVNDETPAVSAFEFGRLVAETATLVNYEINHQKTEAGGYKPTPKFERVDVCISTFNDIQALEAGLEAGSAIGEAVNLAKDLVNAPADDMTPQALIKEARAIAQASNGAIEAKVYGPKELERMKAGAFLSVAKGSPKNEPPALITLSYTPQNAKAGTKLALVGKSITFDSGGLDVKSASNMRDMKGDMAGGAAVLAAIKVIAALKLPIAVQAILPATPNMISSKATKPGAVVTSMSGLTIEIDNTDAEGRLTLADGITFAKKNGATHVVDIATLTGAVFYALGPDRAGIFGNTSSLTELVKDAGQSVGEKSWELPCFGEFTKANHSDMADLKNSGGAFGAGASTAASFVLTFAEKTPAVHMDIAGVSMKSMKATGYGVRTLVEIARRLSQDYIGDSGISRDHGK